MKVEGKMPTESGENNKNKKKKKRWNKKKEKQKRKKESQDDIPWVRFLDPHLDQRSKDFYQEIRSNRNPWMRVETSVPESPSRS